ncbi:hypothetical protein PYW08_013981 [Mythimna loreyi]|uniref:Uncharacterized protein n=1 Tax=Mythimna loreyi TaxID=667449 RepID=A0ACC2R8U6_9NEOP|nr:hypothetical protein PYW08_013981 [Mythimna loreyi]
MRYCVYCKRRYKKNCEISFHRFPKDFEERKIWLQNMEITNWTPKNNHSLCSLHFDEKCINKHFNRTTLKPNSVPTKFGDAFTSSSLPLQSTVTATSTPRLSPSKSVVIDNSSIKPKKEFYTNTTELTNKPNYNYEVSSTPTKARIEYGMLHDHRYEILPKSSKMVAHQIRSLKSSKAKVKTLRQRVKRLESKIIRMKSVINDLIKQKISAERKHSNIKTV